MITPVARLNCNEELMFTDVLKYFKQNTNLKLISISLLNPE